MRLIDADALVEALRKYQYPYGVEFLVRCQPTNGAEPVRHGRWDDDHKCTVCRKEALYEQKPDPYACGLLTLFYVDSAYCPHCGAKMDLEE